MVLRITHDLQIKIIAVLLLSIIQKNLLNII